jgi:biopolymer transport protein TolR
MDTGSQRRGDREPMSQINVTPLVDVMLVLLIIFMVTSTVAQQGVTVSLPKAKANALDVSEQIVTVTIDRSLQVYINATPVDMKELSPKLKEIYAGRKSKALYLKSDKNVAYGDFVKVVSIIKGAGIEQLGMVTEPIKE